VHPRHRIIAALLAVAVNIWPTIAVAEERPQPDHLPDLAAMALAPGDVPLGFHDEYSEWLVPASLVRELLGVEPPEGLQRLYQSFYLPTYELEDGDDALHVFVFEFDSPEAAAEGAAVVVDVLRPPLPPGTTTGPVRVPGPLVAEEPRTTTLVTYDTWAEGGPKVEVTATSFRRGTLIAGVSVEHNLMAPDTDVVRSGSPGGSPAPDATREELAARLAAILDARIQEVMRGDAPQGADSGLASRMLPLEALVDWPVPILGGHKAGVDMLRCGPCGEESPLASLAGTALDGYSRTVFAGPVVDGEPRPPFVSVGIIPFTSPEAALSALGAIRAEPDDLPTTGPFPRGDRTVVETPPIPGADAVVAFQGVMDGEGPDAAPDSAGVDLVVADHLVTVDVNGGLSGEAAMQAAIELATQQVACLAAAGPCAGITRPFSLDPSPADG